MSNYILNRFSCRILTIGKEVIRAQSPIAGVIGNRSFHKSQVNEQRPPKILITGNINII